MRLFSRVHCLLDTWGDDEWIDWCSVKKVRGDEEKVVR